MDSPPGRRELTKRQTRDALRRAAMELFLRDGFDAVTTTQVALAAGVAPATLFNYFATKEDLFFGQVEQLEQRLAALVAACQPGASILARLQSNVLYELTAGRAKTDPTAVATFHEQVVRSAALQSREHEIYDRREQVLRDVLVAALDCANDPLRARLAAAQYIAAEKLIAAEIRVQLKHVAPKTALRRAETFSEVVFLALAEGLGTLPAT